MIGTCANCLHVGGATGVPIPARTAEDTELDFVWWTTLPLAPRRSCEMFFQRSML